MSSGLKGELIKMIGKSPKLGKSEEKSLLPYIDKSNAPYGHGKFLNEIQVGVLIA